MFGIPSHKHFLLRPGSTEPIYSGALQRSPSPSPPVSPFPSVTSPSKGTELSPGKECNDASSKDIISPVQDIISPTKSLRISPTRSFKTRAFVPTFTRPNTPEQPSPATNSNTNSPFVTTPVRCISTPNRVPLPRTPSPSRFNASTVASRARARSPLVLVSGNKKEGDPASSSPKSKSSPSPNTTKVSPAAKEELKWGETGTVRRSMSPVKAGKMEMQQEKEDVEVAKGDVRCLVRKSSWDLQLFNHGIAIPDCERIEISQLASQNDINFEDQLDLMGRRRLMNELGGEELEALTLPSPRLSLNTPDRRIASQESHEDLERSSESVRKLKQMFWDHGSQQEYANKESADSAGAASRVPKTPCFRPLESKATPRKDSSCSAACEDSVFSEIHNPRRMSSDETLADIEESISLTLKLEDVRSLIPKAEEYCLVDLEATPRRERIPNEDIVLQSSDSIIQQNNQTDKDRKTATFELFTQSLHENHENMTIGPTDILKPTSVFDLLYRLPRISRSRNGQTTDSSRPKPSSTTQTNNEASLFNTVSIKGFETSAKCPLVSLPYRLKTAETEAVFHIQNNAYTLSQIGEYVDAQGREKLKALGVVLRDTDGVAEDELCGPVHLADAFTQSRIANVETRHGQLKDLEKEKSKLADDREWKKIDAKSLRKLKRNGGSSDVWGSIQEAADVENVRYANVPWDEKTNSIITKGKLPVYSDPVDKTESGEDAEDERDSEDGVEEEDETMHLMDRALFNRSGSIPFYRQESKLRRQAERLIAGQDDSTNEKNDDSFGECDSSEKSVSTNMTSSAINEGRIYVHENKQFYNRATSSEESSLSLQGSASSSNKIEETYIPPVPFTWDCLTIKTLLEQSKPLLDRLEEPLIKKASLLAYKRMGLEVSHPTTHITSVVQQLQSLIDSPLTPDDKQFPEASILIRVLLAWDNEIEQILGEADTQAANTISTSDSPTSKFALEKSLQSIRVELASRISTLEQKVDGLKWCVLDTNDLLASSNRNSFRSAHAPSENGNASLKDLMEMQTKNHQDLTSKISNVQQIAEKSIAMSSGLMKILVGSLWARGVVPGPDGEPGNYHGVGLLNSLAVMERFLHTIHGRVVSGNEKLEEHLHELKYNIDVLGEAIFETDEQEGHGFQDVGMLRMVESIYENIPGINTNIKKILAVDSGKHLRERSIQNEQNMLPFLSEVFSDWKRASEEKLAKENKKLGEICAKLTDEKQSLQEVNERLVEERRELMRRVRRLEEEREKIEQREKERMRELGVVEEGDNNKGLWEVFWPQGY